MDPSGSLLLTIIERSRAYISEPSVDAKYDNSFIVSHIIAPSLADVLSRIHNNSTTPIVLYYSFTLGADDTYFTIPPSVREVLRLLSREGSTSSPNSQIIAEFSPRDRTSIRGPVWAIEGNEIFIPKSLIGSTSEVELEYIPSGDVMPFYIESATITVSSDRKSITIDTSSPTLGRLDTRPNAYAGSVVRLIGGGSNGDTVEKIISSSSISASNTVVFTLRTALPSSFSTGSMKVETVPFALQPFMEAVTAYAAKRLATMRGVSQVKMRQITEMLQTSIKTVTDQYAHQMSSLPRHFERDTRSNPNYREASRNFFGAF